MTQDESTPVTERAGRLADRAFRLHREFVSHGRSGLEMADDVAPGAAGLIVAEGDSWFDYPGSNVLEALEWHFHYDVWSVAKVMDTLEELVYDERQLAKLASRLHKIKGQGKRPRALLLSAGGNDIAGDELPILINHKNSGLPILNQAITTAVIDGRLRIAWRTYVEAITLLCDRIFGGERIPILIHGYDRPVPDGRGFVGGFWLLPGPWLRPAFVAKGYEVDRDDLSTETAVMADLIAQYNAMLTEVSDEHDHLHLVDLVGTLSNEPGTYREDWRDELHPSNKGFIAVAGKFDQMVRQVTGG